MVDLLVDGYPYVRLCAVLALGKFSNGKVFDQYVEIIQNPDEWHKVRVEALRSLSYSKDPRVIDFIRTWFIKESFDYKLHEACIKTIHDYYDNQLFGTFSQLLALEKQRVNKVNCQRIG